MSPILYESRETDFNHNGLGKMNETLSAIVTEVANGEFELEVVYPIGGRLYKYIQDHMLIKAKPNSVDDPHVFRIYEHTIDTVGQTVTIYAHTKSNDLGQNLVKDVVINSLTPQEAMNRMKINLVEPTDYSFVSDITTRSSTEWKNRNPLNCIAGEEGSLIHYWGGEIKRDNRTVYLYRRRGRDNVAIIRDGKNINGLSLEYSTKGMVTKIIPYRTYTPEDSDDEVVEYGTPVESNYIGNYPLVYVRAIDYSNDDDVTSLETMNAKASQYFTENNGVDKPSVNVSVNLVELSDSSEYEKFKDFENVELFDSVTVYSKQYDINIEAKITTLVYDSLAGKNISLEMGSYRTGLIESTERTYMELIGEKEAKLIQTIQVAANGKNRVFRDVTEPVTGMVKNDIWYQPVGAGETMMYVFDGAYWQLNKVSAGLLGGTLDAENGDVNLINLNASSIVTGTLASIRIQNDFARVGGITGSIVIDSDIRMSATDGSGFLLSERRLSFSDGDYETILKKDGLDFYRGGVKQLGQRFFTYEDGTSGIRFETRHVGEKSLSIRGNQLLSHDGVGGRDEESHLYLSPGGTGMVVSGDATGARAPIRARQFLLNRGVGLATYDTGTANMRLFSEGFIWHWGTSPDTHNPMFRMDSDAFRMYKNLDMAGNSVVGESDIRLKKDVETATENMVNEIRKWRFINFEWDKANPHNVSKPDGRFFGMQAQYAPAIQIKQESSDSYLSIDKLKQLDVVSKALQEIIFEMDDIKSRLELLE